MNPLAGNRARGVSILLTWAYLAHVAAHILLPLAVFLLPELRADSLVQPGQHRVLIIVLLCASTVILWAGFRRHRRSTVFYWGGVGGVCMLAAAFGIGPQWLGHHAAIGVGTAGSLLLAAAHWRNHRLWRQPVVRPAG